MPTGLVKSNLIDKAAEFIKWLEKETDFGVWDDSVRAEVHQKLIAILISEDSNA